ncbi:MAG TPA: FtsX-like permease family protein [Steroidobacteraceae bacterium]|nr:FtsX-like permease family protein [Steroidobacteraceae bacterium]
MLKFLPLLFSNLRRKRVRTTLTIASIVVAFLLFGVLEAFRSALSAGVELAGRDRLVTISKISLIQPLPLSYLERVRAIPGVVVATAHSWFGGIYQDDKNQVVAIVVTPETFFETYPEFVLDEKQKRDWIAERSGAIVGRTLAQRFGWKVGDTIPLRSGIWTQRDGSSTWDLKVSGIFDNKLEGGDTNALYFHWDYFNESRTEVVKDLIGWIVFRIDDPNRAVEIAAKIDQQFANSFSETKTTTEQAFAQGFANQMGNIGAIVMTVAFAVFFTMLLVTANTIGQSVRERTNELAVMKAMGFSNTRVMLLVLLESIFITALGGAIGLGLAALVIAMIGPSMQQFMPFSGLPLSAYGPGIALIFVLGVLAGALPCMQAFQLKITEALRRA